MGPTEWTVISTGLVILIAIAGAFGSLRNELINQRKEMTEGYNALRQEMTEGYNALRQEMGELRERMAKLEGLLEGLREAVSGRHVA